MTTSSSLDPVPPQWQTICLPNSWADALRLDRPLGFLRAVRHFIGPRRQVEVPHDLPGRHAIPDYVLQEFHRLPNGNFSNRWSRGYATSFDRSMLGLTHQIRRDAAAELSGATSVLDIGCGSGALAAALSDAGMSDVWGIDVNPYMLQHANRMYPQIKVVQGLAEATPFPAERFDAVAACFLFHELPTKVQDQVLAEAKRILKPQGKILFIEPSPIHRLSKNIFSLIRQSGIKSLYFRMMSKLVFEPFVADWQSRNHMEWLTQAGFKVKTYQMAVPFQLVCAEKI